MRQIYMLLCGENTRVGLKTRCVNVQIIWYCMFLMFCVDFSYYVSISLELSVFGYIVHKNGIFGSTTIKYIC